MEYSRIGQFFRTPFLFVKNLPGAFYESVVGLPEDIGQGVKGVSSSVGESIGAGLQGATKPIIPVLIVLGAIFALIAIIQIRN